MSEMTEREKFKFRMQNPNYIQTDKKSFISKNHQNTMRIMSTGTIGMIVCSLLGNFLIFFIYSLQKN